MDLCTWLRDVSWIGTGKDRCQSLFVIFVTCNLKKSRLSSCKMAEMRTRQHAKILRERGVEQEHSITDETIVVGISDHI